MLSLSTGYTRARFVSWAQQLFPCLLFELSVTKATGLQFIDGHFLPSSLGNHDIISNLVSHVTLSNPLISNGHCRSQAMS